jgi:hypothetical protein
MPSSGNWQNLRHQRVKQCFEETANAMQDSWSQARDAFNKRHKQNVMERERAAGPSEILFVKGSTPLAILVPTHISYSQHTVDSLVLSL